MKVGIFTFCNAPNYGAALQTYALKKTVEMFGYKCFTINYQGGGNKNFSYKDKEKFIKKNANPLYWFLYSLFAKKKYREKCLRFEKFQNTYFNLIDYNDAINHFLDISVCGSDQIWNPNITNGFDPVYFADGSKFSISYAASAGDVKNIKACSEDKFLDLISNFTALSVREKELFDYLQNKNFKNCSLVLDPTLLLDKEEYLKLINKDKIPDEPYLCLYQLSRDKRTNDIAKKIANEKNLKIIEICGCDCVLPNNKICDAGPIDFLTLLFGASYVITNSFHGTVFSILFEKDFNVVYSTTGNSRINTLLDYFNLKNRTISLDNLDINFDKINFCNIYTEFYKLKNESLRFLHDSLELYSNRKD